MPPSLRLFGTRVSPFMEKVVCGLQWKGLQFEKVSLRTPIQLRRWSPQTGKVPVLEIDGERIYDSTLILRRLEALKPSPSFWSAEPVVAARQRMLEDWADESLYWQLMAERWCSECRAATLEEVAADLPSWIRIIAKSTFLPSRLGRAPVIQGFGRLPREVRLREFEASLDDLVMQLAESPFFFAESLSAADIALYAQLRCVSSGPTPALARAVEARPTLVSHLVRVKNSTASVDGPQ
jgi:glutathione S-transferase